MKILLLTKIFLKNFFKFNYNKSNENSEKSLLKTIFKYIGILILILYIAGLFGFMSYQIINTLMIFQQETLFLGGFLLVIAFFLIFQTIFSSINILYFSKDIEYILPLPLKPYQILAAKFNALLVTEYFTELVFGLAPLIVYGILTSAGIMFYVYGILVMLIFPIIPAIIATFIIIIIMSFAKFSKNRDLFQIVTTILAIVIALGAQFAINDTIQYTEEEMEQMIYNVNNIVLVTTKYFPTVKPALDAMTNSNAIEATTSLVMLAGITGIVYAVFVTAGNKLYLSGAIGNTENSIKVKNKNIAKDGFKQNKVYKTYFLKEVRLLFRNPIYLMQCVAPVILIPIMYLIIFMKGTGSGEPEMQMITTMLTNPNMYSVTFAFIITGIIQFMTMFAFATITAVSRDGKDAIFMKYVPISLYKQFIYKLIMGIILNIVEIIMVLGVLLYFYNDISLVYVAVLFITSLVITILQNYIYLIVDLKRPKLDWDSEYAVVKQNMNMIFQFGAILIVIGVLVGSGILLKDINVYMSLGILILISAIGLFGIDKYVRKNEEKLFEKIV